MPERAEIFLSQQASNPLQTTEVVGKPEPIILQGDAGLVKDAPPMLLVGTGIVVIFLSALVISKVYHTPENPKTTKRDKK